MSDFWSRALGGHPAPPPRPAQYAPAPVPVQVPAAPAVQYPQHPQQEPAPMPVPAQAAYARNDVGLCPNCSSGDYVKGIGMNKARCYACGYPVLHSTSGVVSTNRKQARPARQTEESRLGGYSPHTIIGRIE